jgi:hypothetical protein
MTRMTLIEFLTARLDEDEASARDIHDRISDAYMDDACICDYPDRVLREVEAKRWLVRTHRVERGPIERLDSWTEEQYQSYRRDHRYRDGQTEAYACADCNLIDDRDYGTWLSYGADEGCPTLRHLAAVYADHPEWREEWGA